MNSYYNNILGCIEAGCHLSAVDGDGYCIECGYQEETVEEALEDSLDMNETKPECLAAKYHNPALKDDD